MNRLETTVLKNILYEKNVVIEEKIPKPNGEVITKQYMRGRFLGKGGFARCYEITETHTKRVYAAKIISKTTLTKNKARQKLISEIKIHKSLQHPGIVNFEHVFEDQENVYILLELCSNQSLKELLKRRKRLTEIEVQCYLVQMLGIVEHLHSKLILHRDLKLGNFFLNDKMELKLGDFGLAFKLSDKEQRRNTQCGTPNYVAPEILPEHNVNGHSFKVDVWALGVIIYTLLVGKSPFESTDVRAIQKRIVQRSYSFPENINISESAKELIKSIFTLEQERITLSELQNHKFLHPKTVIPATMPLSTLSCPPSLSYIKNLKERCSEPIKKDYLPTQSPEKQEAIPPENSLPEDPSGSSLGFFKELKTVRKTPILKPEPQNFLSESSKLLPLENEKHESEREKLEKESIVRKWQDYSEKYGLGYMLSDGSVGVLFNDGSKLVLKDEAGFWYIEHRKEPGGGESIEEYNSQNCPRELEKKLILARHFKTYLIKEEEESKTDRNPEKRLVYVKKWMKTKQAFMFRLSNRLIQVVFTDMTQLILDSEDKLLLFIGKSGERTITTLVAALEDEDAELARRLRYTREILTQMVNIPSSKDKRTSI